MCEREKKLMIIHILVRKTMSHYSKTLYSSLSYNFVHFILFCYKKNGLIKNSSESATYFSIILFECTEHIQRYGY